MEALTNKDLLGRGLDDPSPISERLVYVFRSEKDATGFLEAWSKFVIDWPEYVPTTSLQRTVCDVYQVGGSMSGFRAAHACLGMWLRAQFAMMSIVESNLHEGA